MSIVIPAFNEAGRIGATLRAVCDWLEGGGVDAEILVVDDGSTDDTAGVAAAILAERRIAHRVLTGRPNRGKGFSVREGAAEATRAWTLLTDADLSTPIAELERLLAAATHGNHDLVIGSRALPDSRIGVRQSALRENMGRTFNVLVRWITGLPFFDTQCGFKLWRTAAVRPLLERLSVDGFAWDVELLLVARATGLSVAEVAVEWNDASGTKVGLIGAPVRMFWDLVRIRRRTRP